MVWEGGARGPQEELLVVRCGDGGEHEVPRRNQLLIGRSGNKTAPTSDILGICGDITVVTNKT